MGACRVLAGAALVLGTFACGPSVSTTDGASETIPHADFESVFDRVTRPTGTFTAKNARAVFDALRARDAAAVAVPLPFSDLQREGLCPERAEVERVGGVATCACPDGGTATVSVPEGGMMERVWGFGGLNADGTRIVVGPVHGALVERYEACGDRGVVLDGYLSTEFRSSTANNSDKRRVDALHVVMTSASETKSIHRDQASPFWTDLEESVDVDDGYVTLLMTSADGVTEVTDKRGSWFCKSTSEGVPCSLGGVESVDVR